MKRTERPSDLSQKLMTTMRTRMRVPVSTVLLISSMTWTLPSYGLTLIKSNSAGNTFLAPPTVAPSTSYLQNQAPTINDTILFNNTITAGTTYRVSNITTSATNSANGVLNIGGLRVVNPGGGITIQNNDNQNQTINLGSQGIDMSLATQNLAISNATGGAVTLATAAAQAWKVAASRTLTIGGPLNLGHNVALEFYGANFGGTAGIVTLGSTTTGISGAGNLNVTGMIGGSGGVVNLLGNNNAWTGALKIGRAHV